MKLYAISDLHVGFEANRQLWSTLGDHHGDSLILAGDLGETEDHLRYALAIATARFARVHYLREILPGAARDPGARAP
jgi:Icc-related predicted phosphoesterase